MEVCVCPRLEFERQQREELEKLELKRYESRSLTHQGRFQFPAGDWMWMWVWVWVWVWVVLVWVVWVWVVWVWVVLVGVGVGVGVGGVGGCGCGCGCGCGWFLAYISVSC